MQGLCFRCSVLVVAAVVLLSACTAIAPQRAEPSVPPTVEQAPTPVTQTPVETPAEPPPKQETYTVKAGDTLIRIALDGGQSPADIARWNGLSDPSKIGVGQVLRMLPPVPGDTPALVKPTAPSTPTYISPASNDEELSWVWPAHGAQLASANPLKSKGLDIAGVAGDAVLAAADGKVVYAGAGLRGYGNVIIVKHNKTYVSVYAHNQSLSVKEDDTVKRGQKIAAMGSSEADRVKLHFEVRKSGNSVDPTKYLPAK